MLTPDADGYYLIEDADDLAAFRDGVNGGTYAKADARLAADVTLTGDWTPIGTKDAPYKDTFDGAGHEISGLSIYRPNAEDGVYIGLFGCISGGTVRNLTVETKKAEDGQYAVTGYQYVGIIAGYIDNGTTIENCTAGGSVSGTASGDDKTTYARVGGIVGLSDGTSENESNNMITGCVNNAAVHGAGKRVGGIAGYNGGVLTNCVNNEKVSGANSFVGGIAGFNADSATISNCINYAAVSGPHCVGGIAGQNNGGRVTNCVNYGSTTLVGRSTDGLHETIGGIAGGNYGPVTNCISTGEVSDTETTGENIGGVVGGNLVSANTPNYGTTANCGWLSSNGLDGVGGDGNQDGTFPLTEDRLNSIVTMLTATIDNTTIASNGSTTITLKTLVGSDTFSGDDAVRSVNAISSADGVATAAYSGGDTITVSGVSNGTATITVTAQLLATDLENITSDGYAAPQECKFTFNVTVTDEVKLESITIPANVEVKIGGTVKIHVTYDPEEPTNTKITWKSDAPNIATVDETGTVTGVAEGTATITATLDDTSNGAQPQTCTVTVSAAAAPAPAGGGGGGGCSAGWGALALLAAVPLMFRKKKQLLKL